MNTEQLLRTLGRMSQPAPQAAMLKLAGECLDDARLHALRGGTLGEAERELSEQHLHVCEACTERMLTLDMAIPELQGGNRRRILAAADLESQRMQARELAWWRAPQWAGSLVAVAAVALFVIRPGGSPETVPVYSLDLTGQVAEVRGEDVSGTEAQFGSDSIIVLRSFPAQGVPDPLPAAVLYVGGRAGALAKVEAKFAYSNDSSTGMIEVKLEAKTLTNDIPGAYRLAMLLTYEPDAAPATLDPAAEGTTADRLLVKSFDYSRALR